MTYQSKIPQAGQANEYQSHIAEVKDLIARKNGTWSGVNPEVGRPDAFAEPVPNRPRHRQIYRRHHAQGHGGL